MSGGGGGKNVTQSTKVELPDWANQYGQGVTQQAYDFSQQPYQQYEGQRIAPFTANQNTGLDLTAQYAQNNPISQAASNLTADTLNGKYLSQENPAWAPMAQRIKDAYQTGTAAQTDTAFSRAGAFGLGNSAYGQQVQQNQQTYGDSLANLAGNLYNSERDRQTAALGLAPATNAMNLGNYQALIGTGDAQRQYQQDVINQNYADWYNKMMYPQTSASNFANLFPALLGNTGTTQQNGPNPNQINPLVGAVGGGVAGYAAGAYLGGAATPYAPWLGAAVGAGAGYLMSRG